MKNQKVIFTQQQIEQIKENARSKELNVSQLAKKMSVGRTALKRCIRELNLEEEYTKIAAPGRTIVWTPEEEEQLSIYYEDRKLSLLDIVKLMGRSKESISVKAKELNLKKGRRLNITDEQLNDINKCDMSLESIQNLACKYGLTEDGMRLRIQRIKHGYKEKKKYPEFPLQPSEDLLKLLNNPRLNAHEISMKTGYSPYKIQQYRRESLKDFKLKKNYNYDFSTDELILLKIIESLDLAAVPHKQIGKFVVDFYLGHRGCIEMHGRKWHSKEEHIKKDNEKIEELLKMGYKVLVIYDNELDNPDEIKQKIKEFWLTLNPVNCWEPLREV